MTDMKRITQKQFKELCSANQWEAYVQGLIEEAGFRDEFFKKGTCPLFKVQEDGGGSSTPIIGWDGEFWTETSDHNE